MILVDGSAASGQKIVRNASPMLLLVSRVGARRTPELETSNDLTHVGWGPTLGLEMVRRVLVSLPLECGPNHASPIFVGTRSPRDDLLSKFAVACLLKR